MADERDPEEREAAEAMLNLALAGPDDVRPRASWWIRSRDANAWAEYGLMAALGVEGRELDGRQQRLQTEPVADLRAADPQENVLQQVLGDLLEAVEGPVEADFFGINATTDTVAENVPLEAWRLRRAQDIGGPVVIRYGGTIHHELKTQGEEYQRSFSETPGIISPEGVFLSGTSFWIPTFGDGLVSFSLTVQGLQPPWDVVSQGKRTLHELAEDGSRILRWDGVLSAMGQAFFSLSLGMGAIMIYGSYLSHTASIGRTAVVIAGLDTLVAVLAGLAIFPIVFAFGLEPQGGPGLIFMTLPVAFGQMPGGAFFGTLFFMLLVFAAWTSAISLVEPFVTWLVENKGMNRVKAAAWAGLAAWLLGCVSLLSLNVWSEYTLFGKPFIDLMDYVTANLMLPLGGFLIALFAGWLMRRESSMEELGSGDSLRYRLWRMLVRYLAPLAIALVFLKVSGLIEF